MNYGIYVVVHISRIAP